MKLTLKKGNGNSPSLISDFFNTSLIDRDFFDLPKDLFTSRLGVNVPTANISETSKEFKLDLAAPGLERKDFDVEIENHVLKISAEKKADRERREGEYYRREYSFNSFSRSFTLPDNVKEGSIDAKYENGVLKVSIPKEKETPVKPAHKVSVS